MYEVAIDIGGTFTDCVIIDEEGQNFASKIPSTADDPSIGVLNALENGCLSMQLTIEEVLSNCNAFVHGCTIATNAIIEHTGAKTAFITTKGHEDMLLIGKGSQKVAGLTEREIIHTSRLSNAEPLVPRDLVFGINERIMWNGEVLIPLKIEELNRIVEELSERNVESVAVCLLWSFMNPGHEQEIRKLLEERLPNVYCSLSSKISPTFGEYERATSTVINAYVGPKAKSYLTTLQKNLRSRGYTKPLLVMQCEGGTTYAEDAASRAVLIIDSGPVGGVAGGRWLSEKYSEPNIICTDMGGTSFDVGLIYKREPQRENEPVISKYRFRIPKVDIKSIGAGGGSIAWLDDANILRVGPVSAGANPGPACYGRGGQRPTITDADLILGYINPDFFLGGTLSLDKEKAEEALARLSKQIQKDIIEIAHAIFKITNAQMADLIRKCTVERGFNPRNFSLIAYGGAGPTHVAFYSTDVRAKSTYILPNATVFSAFGMLTSPIDHYAIASRRMASPYSQEDCQKLTETMKVLAEKVVSQFKDEGISDNKINVTRSIAMRYKMQVYEIETEVREDNITPDIIQDIVIPRFESEYSEIYGAGTEAKDAGTEIMSCKVIGRCRQFVMTEDSLKFSSDAPSLKIPEPKGKRIAFFEEEGQLKGIDTNIYDGKSLQAGDLLTGPSIVERYGDTVVLPPGYKGEVDSQGIISLAQIK